MDGGDLSVGPQGSPVTIWRRKSELFAAQPGQAEKLLGEGKNPSIAQSPFGTFLAWQRSGEVMVTTPRHPVPKVLAKGTYPQIRALPMENAAVCVWEEDGEIVFQRVE